MEMPRRIVLVVALLGTALMLKADVPLHAAQQDQSKETKKEEDSRYYIYVNGIT